MTPYVARITTVTATTFVTDATAKSGTAPVDGPLVTSAKIGGAWAGMATTSDFPLDFLLGVCTNASSHLVRLNLKNDQTYTVSAAMVVVSGGINQLFGYSSSYGDGGRAVIDGGTSGAAYKLLDLGGINNGTLSDIEFKNNGATGGSTSTQAVDLAGQSGWLIRRCVFRDFRAAGLNVAISSSPIGHIVDECEFYGCNQSNAVSVGALRVSGGSHVIRNTIFHDNTGSNTAGAITTSSGTAHFENCIFDSNGGVGATVSMIGSTFEGCEFYTNGSHGIAPTNSVVAKNCNFVNNVGAGVNNPTAIICTLINCGFGAGTQANDGGDVALTDFCNQIGSITYAADVTPWVDPANGDFRISLAGAKGAGRGVFLQTAASYAGTIGYPDVGAAQHLEVATPSGAAELVNSDGLVG